MANGVDGSAAEESAEIVLHLGSKFVGRDAAPDGEAGVGGGEVGGVIGERAVGRGERREFFPGGGKAHGGRIGFDEEPVHRDGPERGQAAEARFWNVIY